jgi:hypothetical protein
LRRKLYRGFPDRQYATRKKSHIAEIFLNQLFF